MGTPLATAARAVADAGLTWLHLDRVDGDASALHERWAVAKKDIGLLQWGDSVFCLLGARETTVEDLSAVVDHAARRCLGSPPSPRHVCVCQPQTVAGFWYEAAYLPPQFGWPVEQIGAIFEEMAPTAEGGEPPVYVLLGGPPVAARLFGRAVAHNLRAYLAVNELSAPAGGMPCVLLLDGQPAVAALHRMVAQAESVVVPCLRDVAAVVVRADASSTPHLPLALLGAKAVVQLPPTPAVGANGPTADGTAPT